MHGTICYTEKCSSSSQFSDQRNRSTLWRFLSIYFSNLINLLSVAASLSESCPATCGLAEHYVASTAEHYCLRVAENSRDLEAPGAFNIHKKGVRALHKAFELVGSGLGLRGGVEKIDRHFSFVLS